jgi:DNA-3-methyladenine glycosylase I
VAWYAVSRDDARTAADLVVGVDGLARCRWAADPDDYRRYHDDEWGREVHGDRAFFERMTLEAFQSGLSWLTILRKRDGFRAAFDDFNLGAVAAFGPADIDRLMADAGIVRNRRKIEATITNARAAIALIESDGVGAFERTFRDAVPSAHSRPRVLAEVPGSTAESTALSRALKALGFVFVGPTTVYAAMQATGIVDDHLVGCHRAG